MSCIQTHTTHTHAHQDACTKFLIDLGLEIIILYEHIYEIYGDIRGATNCFAIDAYEQGMYKITVVHLDRSLVNYMYVLYIVGYFKTTRFV